MCDLKTFLEGIADLDKGAVVEGETTEINGAPAFELVVGKAQGTTRMWVSTNGENHILRLAHESPAPGDFSLGNYNEPVDVSVPDEDEILDMAGAGN